MFSTRKESFTGVSKGYQISNSVRMRNSSSAQFAKTFAANGNRTTWTMSFWMKMGNISQGFLMCAGVGTGQGNDVERFEVNSGNGIYWQRAIIQTSTTYQLQTNARFKDPSAWYHVVIVWDSNNATAADRWRVYVNGTRMTLSTQSTVSSGQTSLFNSTSSWKINRSDDVSSSFGDNYLAEMNFIDGQALTPSSFGETSGITGVWQPKKYTGTYGTNGFYMNFSDNSAATATTIGKDSSGNGNNWTPTNISVTAGVTYDSMLDVPTPYADGGNGRGNYCTLNPLYKGTNVTATEGNLKYTIASGNFHAGITGTIFPTSGKWYAEFLWNAVTTNTTATAVCRNNAPMVTDPCAFQNTVDTYSPTYRSYIVNGNKDTNTTTAAYGSTYIAGDVIGVALDLDNGKVWFSKNGVWQASGDPAAGTNAAFTDITGSDGWTFGVSGYGSGGDNCNANFGQRPFTYTPPTGFNALNTQNLPDATIKKGNQYFDATLWTGDGTTAKTVVNSGGFQPDFVWNKARGNTEVHVLFDAVRTGDKALYSNLTNAEDSGLGNSFNSNGFTAKATGNINTNAVTYVAWQWNAGGSTVTNTSGSISAQVRANATAGFSIVTYTGTGANATVGHGLGVAPKMIIVKNRSAVSQWMIAVDHSGFTWSSDYFQFDTGAKYTNAASTIFRQAPTSTVFSVGTNSNINGSTNNLVAYCFAAVAGYSAFGSYTGNGSADGPFVFCGFRPRWVLIRSTTAARDWLLYDTARGTYNVLPEGPLQPNTGNAPYGAGYLGLDILSNGFKLRETTTNMNASTETHIYAAFAENPFKYSLAR